MSSLSQTPKWRRNLDRTPRAKPTINLGGQSDLAISLADLADIARSVQQTIGRLLGDSVHVRVVLGETDDDSGQLTAAEIERVAPPVTSDFYTWNLEKALEGKKPLRSIKDLAIPGLDGEEFEAFWAAVND